MIEILQGDCRDVLARLPAASVQTCVTSPPYFGLRDYGVAGQIGQEPSPDEFVAAMVEVFRAVRRVLRDDGTVWLNLGDSYNGAKVGNTNGGASSGLKRDGRDEVSRQRSVVVQADHGAGMVFRKELAPGLAAKQLLMIPARVALALQADGWWLRSHIIWAKPNPMPESVRDRPTNAHESVILLAKRATYFYDADAVREPFADARMGNPNGGGAYSKESGRNDKGVLATGQWTRGAEVGGRNLRNVWTITPKPCRLAHFATMPPDLVERCIKAGSRPGDTVLDPFGGAGTTGLVASRLGRHATLIELNPDYCALARGRIDADAGLLAAD